MLEYFAIGVSPLHSCPQHMPAKNVIRHFVEGGIYHIYNRGVEKRIIFLDDQDYRIFKYYLLVYLYPKEKLLIRYPELPLRLLWKNLSEEVDLLAYCLMPNHFHLLIKQSSRDGITKLMKQVTNAYTQYFNTKYQRTGGLFQGVYKAVLLTEDEVLLHISRYIHLNPYAANLVSIPSDYKWSSLNNYLNYKNTSVEKPELILNYFSSSQSYENFINDFIDYRKSINSFDSYLIDNN